MVIVDIVLLFPVLKYFIIVLETSHQNLSILLHEFYRIFEFVVAIHHIFMAYLIIYYTTGKGNLKLIKIKEFNIQHTI